MTGLRDALRKVAAVVFPWPAKHERRAAIDAARTERERSEAAARRAGALQGQLRKIAADNHFSEAIVQQILRGHK